MTGQDIQLRRRWAIGDRIGGGGFGEVYDARSEDELAVAKFVPKVPGAARELLFVDLQDVRNVIPVVESGEHNSYWVLVMPKAELSLRQLLAALPEPITTDLALTVLTDLADALVDLAGRVVHRDIKPENILKFGEHWCLADFGISRYVEATTAPDTQKFALSPLYAAPERWRSERATSATDVYAVGVVAFEMLAGRRPFEGTTIEALRDQHLHADPPRLDGVPVALAALVDECLYKAPEARPRPANLKARLEGLARPPSSAGLASLQEANRAEVARRGEEARRASAARTESERRAAIAEAGSRTFSRISETLRSAIEDAAPAAVVRLEGTAGWTIRLNEASLRMSQASRVAPDGWGGWEAPAVDVISVASLALTIPETRLQYTGRSHALWYCDAVEAARYAWYETGFMISPLMRERSKQVPFALDPGGEAAKALWSGMSEYQLAWPFTELVVGQLEDFVDRWAGWFAAAAEGRLSQPSSIPERSTAGSWRRS